MSLPEPKSQKVSLQYSSSPSSTLSNLDIPGASWSIVFFKKSMAIIIRSSACIALNTSTVYSYAVLVNYTTVEQVSE